MDRPSGKIIDINDRDDRSDNLDEENNNSFSDNGEGDTDLVNISEEDEDLLAEINKEKETNERFEVNENYERIKQGFTSPNSSPCMPPSSINPLSYST